VADVRHVPVTRFGRAGLPTDAVVVEEPLEIRIAGEPVVVVMRTPGEDVDLAAGLILTEGILASAGDIGGIAHCRDAAGRPEANVVNVIPAGGAAIRRPAARTLVASAACGVCGKASIDEIAVRARPIDDDVKVDARVLAGLDSALAAAQVAFAATGGLHAAGLFAPDGRLLCLREDVGRHNAVDKVVGRFAVADELPLPGRILIVSGRLGFEIVQKALVAGIPVVAGVGAPTSLAVELAAGMGQTLVGFLRGGAFNAYAGAGRITPARP
jgi:FdhD protein